MEIYSKKTHACKYCGQFFKPDKRLGDRQKSCGKESCRKKRKKENQESWCKRNPAYFNGRYANTKEWRRQQKDKPVGSINKIVSRIIKNY